MTYATTLPGYDQVAKDLSAYFFYFNQVGDWAERRDMRRTWGLMKPSTGPETITLPEFDQEDEAMADYTGAGEHESGLIFNLTHNAMQTVADDCGTVFSKNGRQLWVTGLSSSRGNIFRLSHDLKQVPGVEAWIRRAGFDVAGSTQYGGDVPRFVLGLPYPGREQLGPLVRQIAMIVFGRIKKVSV